MLDPGKLSYNTKKVVKRKEPQVLVLIENNIFYNHICMYIK